MIGINSSRSLLRIAICATMFGAVAVHAQNEPSSTSGTSSTQAGQAPTAATGGAKSASVNRADQTMMRDLAYANIAEIEAGKLAQSKSQNEQVKSFAQKMVDDHTKALQELQQVAQAKGVTLPTTPDKKNQTRAKKMNGLSAAEFDRQYIAQGGLADHKSTHRLLQRIQSRASDPDLKQLASKTLPVVDQHLNLAQETQAAVKSGATQTQSSGSTTGTAPAGASGTSGGAETSGGTGTTKGSGTSEPSGTSGGSSGGSGG